MIYATVLGQYQHLVYDHKIGDEIMKRLLVGLLVLGSFSSFADTIIKNPGIENGTKIVGTPTAKSFKKNIRAYIYGVMNCTLVYNCGELETAKDNFSKDSDLNGICKVQGFTEALGHTVGTIINPFGNIIKVNNNGVVVSKKLKESRLMPSTESASRRYLPRNTTADGWFRHDGFVEVIYEAKSKDVITSISCK